MLQSYNEKKHLPPLNLSIRSLSKRTEPLIAENMIQRMIWLGTLFLSSGLHSQNLPFQWTLDPANHLLTIGGVDNTDFFDPNTVPTIEITFDQSNWWTQLTNNYNSATPLEATITIDGSTYAQVGVRFKGQTSYMMVNGQKKSFNITLDEWIDGQDHEGYESFNLQNGAFDASFLREFIYERIIRRHIPAAQCNFSHLYINGEDWGLYPNLQQLNKQYLEEWFLDNDGTRWRADAPSGTTGGPGGGGPGGGPQWGDGTAALNWLGADTADYQDYYTLKSSSIQQPWDDLVATCDVLENTPMNELYATLNEVMDVDRALWFLASEILFSDDDGYVYKGKMDYFLYFDVESGRMHPLEYDGNTVMEDANVNWSPFYHADNSNYPLLYRLMQVPELRQRYLAHMRTLLSEALNPDVLNEEIETWANFIDALVAADPKKLYTYNQFLSEVNALQDWVEERSTVLNSNVEIAQEAPAISGVEMTSPEGTWENPLSMQEVTISASATSTAGVAGMNLYWSDALDGVFNVVAMTGNGASYSANIPGLSAGSVVRFYVEAIGANAAGSRSYAPAGAEHDVFYYEVEAVWAAASDVVINEVMAKNTQTAYDELNQTEDWIELYNNGLSAIDLTGYALTDNGWNLDKWPIPDGTVIQPNEYLIVWADEDGADGPMHANFKLSAEGETVWLMNSAGEIADQVVFGAQEADMGYARIPNGTGNFELHAPTFAGNNDYVGVNENDDLTYR
ncbi:MAG: hypothetical protein RL226_2372, partial [Bacteroidota bacterium]